MLVMTSLMTNKVAIEVEAWFHEDASSPDYANFVYAYQITIVNKAEYPIQLLSREWRIKDTGTPVKIVKGLGVVGEQPILHPGQVHQYISGCNFRTPLGSMVGSYTFQNLDSGGQFKVRIPKFVLAFPYTLN